MTTIRQIERCWVNRQYEKLFRELLEARPEAAYRFEIENGRAIPAAALALIRLDELSQSHVPLYGRLVRAVLAAQSANDGGWGDLVATALCLRALLNGRGNGVAVERGLEYLANLQKAEGIWPNVPLRRMPADAYVSAFVLHQLGDNLRFREAVRFEEAVKWFEANARSLDTNTARLWDHAAGRCHLPLSPAAEAGMAAQWS